MILSSFKLQNPLTARKDKNVRSKNIRRLESGWRRKANPKTLPSRTKEFILDNPLESAVLGVGAALGARYLIKGIKTSKINSTVIGANNVAYNNPIISSLNGAKKAFDDDVIKVKDVWNATINGKSSKPLTTTQNKILERKRKISSNLKDSDLNTIQNQIKNIRSQYIVSSKGKTIYKPNLTKKQINDYQNQVKILTSKIKTASIKARKNSSYNLKSHLSFF